MSAAIDKAFRVLVVDRLSTDRRIIANLLAQNGVTAIGQAADGATALERLHDGSMPIDLVIVDMAVEPGSGLEFLRAVRADPSLQALPIIATIGADDQAMLAAAAQAGASGCLAKPFNAETLERKIAAVLGDASRNS